MKAIPVVALAVLALAVSSVSASGSTDAHYVFSFKHGLHGAAIGGATAGYTTLFGDAVRLKDSGSGLCFGLAYAVSATAQRAHKADLELFCGDSKKITEAHFASSAFCSTGGTCIATPGSLRKFAAELKAAAWVEPGTECLGGGEGCTSVEATFGRTHVSLRSSNCPKFKSLAAIGSACVAGDLLIYQQA